jgi:uncharacterized damage-inducible protein DinB
MITVDYMRTMARYNAWQNQSLIAAAGTLDQAAREQNRGAFFGSIQATFNHLLWGDQTWMSRFAGTPAPRPASIAESVAYFDDWEAFVGERVRFDRVISDWAMSVDPEWLSGDLTWHSNAIGRDVSKPRALLVMQLFNHQTHHRGQIHAMLTAAGALPEATDLQYMPDAG